MNDFEIEEQKIDEIKKFFSKNKKLLVGGVLVVCAFIFGNSYFNHHLRTQSISAAEVYHHVLLAVEQKDTLTARTQASIIVNNFSSTAYYPLAQLILAKLAVEENDLDTAINHLQALVDKNKGPASHIARVRLARVLYAKGQHEQALSLLDYKSQNGFAALYAKVKGDLLTMENKVAQAKESYQVAKDKFPSTSNDSWLKLKMMDLGMEEVELISGEEE